MTSIDAIAAKQTVKDSDNIVPDAAVMLTAPHADNKMPINNLKSAKELAEQAGDNPTDGLLDD